MSGRPPSRWPGAGKAVIAVVAMVLLAVPPTSVSGTPSLASRPVVASFGVDHDRAELEKAQLAKKQAGDEKAKAYLDAHLLYKNCDRDFRPFCLRSAQMMMRMADARYKERERREFPNLAAWEAAAKIKRDGSAP